VVFLADLHAMTMPHDPAELRQLTLEVATLLLAAGVDPDRSLFYAQSQVPEHTELHYLLECATRYGEARRMIQFKERSSGQGTRLSLLTYPVLMAADILLYQTDIVPIGDDQRQHLELARDVAQRFNGRFGETFKLPRGVYPGEGARIMDLTDPEKKMSTSTTPEPGKILMTDPPEVIRKKIMSAVTDTGREVRRAAGRPGISNLVEIMSVASGRSPEDVEREFEGQGYGRFKAAVADAVIACLEPIRTRYGSLRADPAELERLLGEGARRAVEASQPTLTAMYDRMGFVSRSRD
jgi:tryptophanyl-tRNA synthetase